MFSHAEATKNHLLAALPAGELDRLEPMLERVSLSAGQVLHYSAEKLEYVYFPVTAVVTLLYPTESGMTVEVGMIGSEGFLGIEIFLGDDSAPSMGIVQNAGIAYRMRARDFRAKCATAPACQNVLLLYTQVLLTEASQTAVCNRFHSTKQRLARWLLESVDRLSLNRLAMTHEQIARVLGVRREGVTTAAHELSVSGLIKVARGGVTVLDRSGLESAACECYEVVFGEYIRLLGRRIPRTFTRTNGIGGGAAASGTSAGRERTAAAA